MSQSIEFASFEPPTPAELSAMLPRYEFCDFIAQGGMAAVYLARQPSLDRFVAVKVLPALPNGEVDAAALLTREARAMARLTHNNIVTVHDFGLTESGWFYLVMEHVEGQTLHEIIQSRKLTLQSVRSITLQLCDALIFAHEHGIVHRDIKPSNILVNREGRVKLADFGLARPLTEFDQEVALGTPDYVAPEILSGDRVDHRADIYALGVVVFEMLTGRVPWSQDGKVAAVMPEGGLWNEVVHKAIRPSPEQRFCDMREFRAAVLRATAPTGRRASASVASTSAPTPERRRRLRSRSKHKRQSFWSLSAPLTASAKRLFGRSKTGTPTTAAPPQKTTTSTKPAATAKPASKYSHSSHRVTFSLLCLLFLGAGGWWSWPQFSGIVHHLSDWTPVVASTSPVSEIPEKAASPSPPSNPIPPTSILPEPAAQTVSHLHSVPPDETETDDGTVLAKLQDDRKLEVDLVPPGHVVQMQESHDDWITSIALFPDARRIATASADGTAGVWDAARGQWLIRFGPFEHPIQKVAVSPDGNWIAAGGRHEDLRVWNASNGKLVARQKADGSNLTGLAFSSDGQWLLYSCTHRGTSLRAWQWRDSESSKVLKSWEHTVNSFAFLPVGNSDPQRFFTVGGGRDEQGPRMELWLGDLHNESPSLKLRPRPMIPARVAVSPDGHLVAFTQGTTLHIVEVQQDRDLSVCVGHEGMVETLQFLQSGKFLLSSAQDRTIRIWSTDTGEEVYRFTANTLCTSNVCVSADERWLISGGGMRWGSPIERDGDYALHIWRLPDLSNIETESKRLARAREEFNRLEEVDPALASLRNKLIKDWAALEARAQSAMEESSRATQDLTSKYLAALRRELTSQRGENREAFLKEIDRVVKREPLPSYPRRRWPQALRSLFTIYRQELRKLQVDTKAMFEHETRLQLSAVNHLIQRRAQSDEMSQARARVLMEEVLQRQATMEQPQATTQSQQPQAPTPRPQPR